MFYRVEGWSSIMKPKMVSSMKTKTTSKHERKQEKKGTRACLIDKDTR